MRSLIQFNGRGRSYRINGAFRESGHLYIGAYSISDAVRALQEAGFENVSRHEVEKYFSKDAWGNAMAGTELERGVRAMPRGSDFDPEAKPVRLL